MIIVIIIIIIVIIIVIIIIIIIIIITITITIIIDSFVKRNSPKTKFKPNALYITHGITNINYFNTYT